MRRARLVPALAAVLVLSSGLVACSKDAEPEAEPPTSEQPESQAPEEPDVWPLTGLPVKDGDTTVRDHPVYVVKVENNSSAVPQRGLQDADLVVEELVEGNTTRLAAFFYSTLPKEVGPIRSMRASDIGIVPAEGAVVVTSGAAPQTIKRIQEAGITFLGEGTSGVYRESSRSAPHNVFASLVDVAKKAKMKDVDPADYLVWGDAAELPKGKKAATITVDFGNQVTRWSAQGDQWEMTNSYAGDQPFPTDTVLVLRVQIGDAGYKDMAGSFVPETKFEGQGQMMLFHGGKVVTGTWSKDGLRGALTLTTKAGDEVKVPAGHTFIELVPAENGSVTFTKR